MKKLNSQRQHLSKRRVIRNFGAELPQPVAACMLSSKYISRLRTSTLTSLPFLCSAFSPSPPLPGIGGEAGNQGASVRDVKTEGDFSDSTFWRPCCSNSSKDIEDRVSQGAMYAEQPGNKPQERPEPTRHCHVLRSSTAITVVGSALKILSTKE